MADTTIHTGRLPGYENAPQNTTPEYFWYLFNGSLVMGKDGSLPLLLENTPGNECVMRVRYTLADGTVLLTTPIIRTEEYLLYAYPDFLPEAGSYPVTVSILVFHAQQDSPPPMNPLLPTPNRPPLLFHRVLRCRPRPHKSEEERMFYYYERLYHP